MFIKMKIVNGGKIPEYKSEMAACADCYARLPTPFITVLKGARCYINLGFCIELPAGYEAVIRPRSGLTKIGIDIEPGTIDADYRGEVKACLINNSGEEFKINNFDRICQMKIQKAEQFKFLPVVELTKTKRGEAGFGSTGV